MKLSNQNIDETIKDIQKFFEAAGIPQKDILKICLVLEESLIQYKEQFGEEHEFTVRMKKWFSAPKVIIRMKGKPFNPLKNEDAETSIFNASVMQTLLHCETAGTAYRYEGTNYQYELGYNEITAFSTKEKKPIKKIPGGWLTVMLVAAIICSFLIGFFPNSVQSLVIGDIVPLINNLIIDLIMAVMGPFIFIAVLSSILSIDSADTLSNVGLKIIGRFFAMTLITGAIAAVVSQFFYPVLIWNGENSAVTSNKTLELLSNIVPKNIFSPFIDGNLLQIVLLAIGFGIPILMLSNTFPELKKIIMELKFLWFKIMDMVSTIMLLTIFLSVFQTLTTNSLEAVLGVWKIIAINYITLAIISGVMLLNIYLRYKVKIKDFFNKLSEVFLMVLSTGSTTIVMSKNMEVSSKAFNIDEKFCSFWIPLAQALCVPTKGASYVICVFYGAADSNSQITMVALLTALFLALQLSFAGPIGPGSTMPIYLMMLGQVGLPLDTIGEIMIADVFIVNISAVVLMITKDCELIDIAHKLNYIKQENKND